jgi:hypothetical protein
LQEVQAEISPHPPFPKETYRTSRYSGQKTPKDFNQMRTSRNLNQNTTKGFSGTPFTFARQAVVNATPYICLASYVNATPAGRPASCTNATPSGRQTAL